MVTGPAKLWILAEFLSEKKMARLGFQHQVRNCRNPGWRVQGLEGCRGLGRSPIIQGMGSRMEARVETQLVHLGFSFWALFSEPFGPRLLSVVFLPVQNVSWCVSGRSWAQSQLVEGGHLQSLCRSQQDSLPGTLLRHVVSLSLFFLQIETKWLCRLFFLMEY